MDFVLNTEAETTAAAVFGSHLHFITIKQSTQRNKDESECVWIQNKMSVASSFVVSSSFKEVSDDLHECGRFNFYKR